MAKLRLARAARDDIREIRSYSIASFGAAVAFDYIEGLRAELKNLGEKPLIGSAEDDLAHDLRSFLFRSHRVYYRVAERVVLIVRILHHARDARTILGRIQ